MYPRTLSFVAKKGLPFPIETWLVAASALLAAALWIETTFAACGGGTYTSPAPAASAEPAPARALDPLAPPTHSGSSNAAQEAIKKAMGSTRSSAVTGSRTAAAAGGLTRKSRGRTTPQITWEVWWARNRYQFFEIKDFYENMARLYPITPRPKSAEEIKDVFAGTRERCLETFRTYQDSKHAALRRIAVLALGRMKDPSSLERMMTCLQENNEYVRKTAIIALGIHGSPEARHSLFHIALGTDEAAKALGGAIAHETLRIYALLALAITETPGSAPILETVALDPSAPRSVRAMALEGLIRNDSIHADFVFDQGADIFNDIIQLFLFNVFLQGLDLCRDFHFRGIVF